MSIAISDSIDQAYAKVEELSKKGLNPTLNVRLIPNDPTKLTLNYLEKDTANGDINSDITIVVSKPGPPTEENKEIVSTLELTSEGYSSEFYFQELKNELKLLIKEFKKSFPQDSTLVLHVYSSTSNVSRNQSKVYGDLLAVPAYYPCPGGDFETCNSGITVNACIDITIDYGGLNQGPGICSSALENNTSDGNGEVGGTNCNWNGSCLPNSQTCCGTNS